MGALVEHTGRWVSSRHMQVVIQYIPAWYAIYEPRGISTSEPRYVHVYQSHSYTLRIFQHGDPLGLQTLVEVQVVDHVRAKRLESDLLREPVVHGVQGQAEGEVWRPREGLRPQGRGSDRLDERAFGLWSQLGSNDAGNKRWLEGSARGREGKDDCSLPEGRWFRGRWRYSLGPLR